MNAGKLYPIIRRVRRPLLPMDEPPAPLVTAAALLERLTVPPPAVVGEKSETTGSSSLPGGMEKHEGKRK